MYLPRHLTITALIVGAWILLPFVASSGPKPSARRQYAAAPNKARARKAANKKTAKRVRTALKRSHRMIRRALVTLAPRRKAKDKLRRAVVLQRAAVKAAKKRGRPRVAMYLTLKARKKARAYYKANPGVKVMQDAPDPADAADFNNAGSDGNAIVAESEATVPESGFSLPAQEP